MEFPINTSKVLAVLVAGESLLLFFDDETGGEWYARNNSIKNIKNNEE